MLFSPAQAELANASRNDSLVGHLDIRFHTDPDGRLCATMPVDARTHQPMGLLHGGATAALAESLGSVGSLLLINAQTQAPVGIEINVNHLKGVRSGRVTATAELLHQGRSTHVWDMRVRNDGGDLIAVCRLTVMIVDRK